LPKIRKNPLIEILAINTGCLNQCTYCKTKHARGDLASYPVAELCERVAAVVDGLACTIEVHGPDVAQRESWRYG
jgi:threonylcarbamoyladenosine tRNA methylthiotransferase CDKAL1